MLIPIRERSAGGRYDRLLLSWPKHVVLAAEIVEIVSIFAERFSTRPNSTPGAHREAGPIIGRHLCLVAVAPPKAIRSSV